MDKARGMLLWRRLRISNYVNVTLILIFFALITRNEPPPNDVVAICLLILIPSHLNYHYQLAAVASFLGKSSIWVIISFTTFPLGPLISYLAIKPAAMKFGLTD
ncbi:hypothetical protein [Ferrigenium kumadai]|uniref:hypothetical protein n=1 Tax=Ferrigenium kumadai TaxID=1682490 RepID=UPI001BB4474B|nr:hypothetical protein [Ferrigenium kumadai]